MSHDKVVVLETYECIYTHMIESVKLDEWSNGQTLARFGAGNVKHFIFKVANDY